MGRIIPYGKDYPIYYGKIKNVPNHQPVLTSHLLNDKSHDLIQTLPSTNSYDNGDPW